MMRRDDFQRFDEERYPDRDARIPDAAPRNRPEYGLERPNRGSARSDYGRYAYGGRLNESGIEREGRWREDRGFFERAGDEVRSWFGDDEAERRRRMDEREDERRERGGRWSGSARRESNWRGTKLWSNVRARDVLTRNVVTVHPNDTAEHAARLMLECDCGALPVVDGYGRLIGMVTDRDITIRLVARGSNIRHARVADCMTDQAFACHQDDPIEGCMREMSRHQVRRLPIINDRGQVVGIVSQSDLARHAGTHPGTGERRAMADVLCAVSEPSSSAYR